MTILDALILKLIFILFPLFCYFLFAIYQKNVGQKTGEILFDVAIYSAVYLMLNYSSGYTGLVMALITTPLLIAYLKGRIDTVIILSVIIGLYYFTLNINIIFIVIEFISYYLIYIWLKRKKWKDYKFINVFVSFKSVYLIISFTKLSDIIVQRNPIIYHIIGTAILLYLMSHLVYRLLKRCEEIASLHLMTKELEKEKQLRDSLFKITHEIKNPIAVCKGYLDMFDIDNKNHAKKYVPIIKQEIDRTIMLMNDFLNLTKLKVEKRRIDLFVLLEDVYDLVETLIRHKKITFEYTIIDDEIYLYGDYDRLKQVFINIIKNSIESLCNNEDGIIQLEVKLFPKVIKIYITDNGEGMCKEVLKKIGEPFFTTKPGGTGLGVKFSREIIEAHKGNIIYESNKNKGTKVIINLPYIKKS
jgi:two-component system, sporulation sensor kinase B